MTRKAIPHFQINTINIYITNKFLKKISLKNILSLVSQRPVF
jgi:hypothetical protein